MMQEAEYGELPNGMMDQTAPGDFADDGQAYYGDDGDGGEYQMYSGALVGSHAGEEFATLPSGILNAKPKPRLTDEEKLARDCMRRRQSDLERRARIFDAKRRMIGVDKETLDAQVAEKQAQKDQDKGSNRKVDRDMAMIDKQLKLIEVEKQKRRREQEMSCKEYSIQNLNFQARREYDLNDPLYKRKGVPARVGDDDARCGASSMQKFSGEDLMKAERVKQQRAEMVSIIEQQKFEREMLRRRGNDAEGDNKHFTQVEEITELRNEIEANEVTLRKELQRKQHDDNLYQANDNAERRNALVRSNMEANERELNHHSTDKFLNEQAPSHFNNRVIRDAYKGSSRDERIQVAAQQRQQCMEKEMTKSMDDHDDRCYANAVEGTRKQLIAMERDKQRRKREQREQMAQDNLQMQAQQTANVKQNNQMYKNEFSPEFFEQFGNGCR
jgi:hypothetical protein